MFTCVSVSLRLLENSALSAILRYCLSLNFFSSARSCCVVNGVLGFLLGLCFLRLHLSLGGSPLESTAKKKRNKFTICGNPIRSSIGLLVAHKSRDRKHSAYKCVRLTAHMQLIAPILQYPVSG